MPQITLEHTSRAADLPIFKFCKFFDGDGEKKIQIKLQKVFVLCAEKAPFNQSCHKQP